MDWRESQPPMIPIYFCSIDKLEEVCEDYPLEVLSMVLDYFVYFEKFEEATVMKKLIEKTALSLELEDIKTQSDFSINTLVPGTPSEAIQRALEDYDEDYDDEDFEDGDEDNTIYL